MPTAIQLISWQAFTTTRKPSIHSPKPVRARDRPVAGKSPNHMPSNRTQLNRSLANFLSGTRDMPPGAFSRRSSQLPLIPLHHHFAIQIQTSHPGRSPNIFHAVHSLILWGERKVGGGRGESGRTQDTPLGQHHTCVEAFVPTVGKHHTRPNLS